MLVENKVPVTSASQGPRGINEQINASSAGEVIYTVPEGRMFTGYTYSTSISRSVRINGVDPAVNGTTRELSVTPSATYPPGAVFASSNSGQFGVIGIEKDLA